MKRRTFSTAALASLATTLLGCDYVKGVSGRDHGEAHSGHNHHGVQEAVGDGVRRYVIGVDDTFAPMEFRNAAGLLLGYDIDLAAAVMQKAGLQYEFKPINWGKKEELLLQDKYIDLIWSTLHITPERKSIFLFSNPYFKTKFQAAVLAQSAIQSRADLEGKVIGYKAASPVSAVLQKKELPGGGAIAKSVAFPETSLAMAEMLAGKVDAVIDAHQPLSFYAANSPGKFKILGDVFMELEVAVAARPADKHLIETINKSLSELEESGAIQDIHKRWFGA